MSTDQIKSTDQVKSTDELMSADQPCHHMKGFLSAYLDDKMPAAARLYTYLHLSHCKHCKSAFGDLKKLVSQLNTLGSPSSSIGSPTDTGTVVVPLENSDKLAQLLDAVDARLGESN